MRRPTRGRSVALVAFIYGLTGHEVLPGPVVRQLLSDLGVGESASRALLARMTRHGQLASTRRGREADYRLAGSFAADFARIRDRTWRPGTAEWEGGFHALLHQVSEDHRDFRDALRRRAVLAGYGVLQAGTLICTRDRTHELDDLLDRVPSGSRIWSARLMIDEAGAAEMAGLAWDLPELGERFERHVRTLSDLRPAGPTPETFRTYAESLAPAFVDLGRQPDLPPALLPPEWPGLALTGELRRTAERFGPDLGAYLESVTGRS